MKWVIDASVAAKWVAPETESAQAEALLDHELLVPDLFFAEIANIFWKKQSRGEMDTATVQVAALWMAQAPLQVTASADLFEEAVSLSLQLNHPAYDCFYLALARQSGCSLVTADKRLVERCRRADATDIAGLVMSLETNPH